MTRYQQAPHAPSAAALLAAALALALPCPARRPAPRRPRPGRPAARALRRPPPPASDTTRRQHGPHPDRPAAGGAHQDRSCCSPSPTLSRPAPRPAALTRTSPGRASRTPSRRGSTSSGAIRPTASRRPCPRSSAPWKKPRVEGLTENDITPPYNDATKGQKITATVGTDGYLLGTIEALSVDPNSRNVNLTVSATLYDASTGASVKSLAYTGHGISYNATDDPQALLQSAVNDVAGHVVSALNASSAQQQTAVHYYVPGRRAGTPLQQRLDPVRHPARDGPRALRSRPATTAAGAARPRPPGRARTGVPNPPVVTVPQRRPAAPPTVIRRAVR